LKDFDEFLFNLDLSLVGGNWQRYWGNWQRYWHTLKTLATFSSSARDGVINASVRTYS